jgi:hypothetical protein
MHNERIKLLAVASSNLGIGMILAGIVAPFVNGNLGDAPHLTAWLAFGANFVGLGYAVLGRLQ